MRQASLGIAANLTPEWRVDRWFGLSDGRRELHLSDITVSRRAVASVAQHGLDGTPWTIITGQLLSQPGGG